MRGSADVQYQCHGIMPHAPLLESRQYSQLCPSGAEVAAPQLECTTHETSLAHELLCYLFNTTLNQKTSPSGHTGRRHISESNGTVAARHPKNATMPSARARPALSRPVTRRCTATSSSRGATSHLNTACTDNAVSLPCTPIHDQLGCMYR